VLLHFQVGLRLYVIPKWALQELEDPQRLMPPFKGEHLERVRTYLPQGQAPRSSTWLVEISGSSKYPRYD
jgi:hypothetical protein